MKRPLSGSGTSPGEKLLGGYGNGTSAVPPSGGPASGGPPSGTPPSAPPYGGPASVGPPSGGPASGGLPRTRNNSWTVPGFKSPSWAGATSSGGSTQLDAANP